MEYLIFAVGVVVTLMVCGGMFYATATEMVSHAYHSADEKQPITLGQKQKSEKG